MPKVWSETPAARVREATADLLTAAWLLLWGLAAWQLYAGVARFARAGEVIRQGGVSLESAGAQIGGAFARVPLIGRAAGEVVHATMSHAAAPWVAFGADLERLVVVIAAALGLIVLAVPAGFWLIRYLPWRRERLRSLRAAHRVIRTAPRVAGREVERVLASRALHRLSYEALLEFSPDPIGDWVAERFDRLARAELESVGLRSPEDGRTAQGVPDIGARR